MLFTNVQFSDSMYKCVTCVGQCIVMYVLIFQIYSLRRKTVLVPDVLARRQHFGERTMHVIFI